jgi:hypothetical protein
MNLDEFDRLTRDVRLMGKTRRALRRVMVYGSTWRDAARFADIHESTIMRAKNRIFGDRLVVHDPAALMGKDFVPKGQTLLLLSQYRRPKYEGEVGALVTRKGETKATIHTRIILERNLDVQQDPGPLQPGHGSSGQQLNVTVGGQAKARRRRVATGATADSDCRVEASHG